MSNTQHEALYIANSLEAYPDALAKAAAAQLRRMHELNQELLATLQTILNISLMDNSHWAKTIEREAHAAIIKVTGAQS